MARVECCCERRHGEMESGHLDLSHAWALAGSLKTTDLQGRD